MSNNQSVKEQTCNTGHSRRQDILYRSGLVIQTIGLALLAVLYPLESPFYTAGIMLFEIGVLLSAIFLRVSVSAVKIIVLASVVIGFALQIAGYVAAAEQYAGTLMIAGIGFVCLSASGIVGKEAYCFGYREGWLLVVLFPIIVFINLVVRENVIFNSVGFSFLFLLLLSLTGKKLKQPLLSK